MNQSKWYQSACLEFVLIRDSKEFQKFVRLAGETTKTDRTSAEDISHVNLTSIIKKEKPLNTVVMFHISEEVTLQA